MPELMKPEQYLAKREAYAYPAVRPGDERGTVSKRYNQRDGSTHCQADQDTIPELEVGKKDMRFEVEGGGNERIGTLLVSKGGVEWSL